MYIELLKELNQTHIVEEYLKGSIQQQNIFQQQIKKLEKTYPGGLRTYYSNAIKLIKQAEQGNNPYSNYTVTKPKGVNLTYADKDIWQKYQNAGIKQLQNVAFVLVAGGLGERLGYPGIKIAITMQLLTNKCFLQYYCEYILAFQSKFCSQTTIPFVIMTSEDTHDKTLELLVQNKYFGLNNQDVCLIKQERVPAMVNSSAQFGFDKVNFKIQTKPHGHGDVHTLLYMSGVAEKWHIMGKKWIIIFQDTNPFSIKNTPLLLGISSHKNLDYNSLCIRRKPGQTYGAITTLTHKQTKSSLTVNVQYNQLQDFFKQSGGEPLDEQGFSVFPGNINCLSLKIDTYVQTLRRSHGLVNEIINPKYLDETKTKFKSSMRLQCLMQDYPKLLTNCDRVEFTEVPRGYCFTTLKNDLITGNKVMKKGLSGESAGSCEADIYVNNRIMFRLCGAEVEQGEPLLAGGAQLSFFPMIEFSPKFATCLTELKAKLKKVKITKNSSLVINSQCILQDLELDGHLQINENGSINKKHLNKNYIQIIDLEGNEPPYLQIRGYKFNRANCYSH